jgi:hypothetical protein
VSANAARIARFNLSLLISIRPPHAPFFLSEHHNEHKKEANIFCDISF